MQRGSQLLGAQKVSGHPERCWWVGTSTEGTNWGVTTRAQFFYFREYGVPTTEGQADGAWQDPSRLMSVD